MRSNVDILRGGASRRQKMSASTLVSILLLLSGASASLLDFYQVPHLQSRLVEADARDRSSGPEPLDHDYSLYLKPVLVHRSSPIDAMYLAVDGKEILLYPSAYSIHHQQHEAHHQPPQHHHQPQHQPHQPPLNPFSKQAQLQKLLGISTPRPRSWSQQEDGDSGKEDEQYSEDTDRVNGVSEDQPTEESRAEGKNSTKKTEERRANSLAFKAKLEELMRTTRKQAS